MSTHIPVLLHEVVEVLNPLPGKTYLDATIDGGGHSREILKRMKGSGVLLGIDRDCDLLEETDKFFHQLGFSNARLVCGNFSDLDSIARASGVQAADGILFDLGFSSYHLEQSGRGFSFLRDEMLDMRYNPNDAVPTAAGIINTLPEHALAKLFQEYGEERFARRIARAVGEARAQKQISTTRELTNIIVRALPRYPGSRRIHPATRVFQALRMSVNNELEHCSEALRHGLNLLAPSGKMAAITFHSLEDRLVKNLFKQWQTQGEAEVLTKKPIRPSSHEIHQNPRARSAKLRAIQKVGISAEL
ncbi:MAG: 16S rRNA (cytosine(1402)-N(4))-methyltransferase RsmH [Candidatus Sungbacteria bacterium]|nr:16S rRNA (cytosine(1402)-N(4))-methyltransferase RsmH [Candidatus Sungbacteria bacterium]